ncbi:hypothetical protein M431DRAFT_195494 [Trichoderma harzianum CBS 226.95]|uniref:Uncharacterized protein n=1 Tax=Trichoderma harzianum CBS 226.95 TaxID=983964 RepID=A0A2T4AUK5_TRIHA|nr:hypothetical protein M431DRAFT_195494 [Trichoderma harzianum CBS 226.95]PTB60744.1 hypothetical protein M431DRAFT_195494 [Trichoderma harzianum CBS 226.95]
MRNHSLIHRWIFFRHPHAFGIFSPRGLRVFCNGWHIGILVIVDLSFVFSTSCHPSPPLSPLYRLLLLSAFIRDGKHGIP